MRISLIVNGVTSKWEFDFGKVTDEDVWECLVSILNKHLKERLGWRFSSCFEFEGKICCVTKCLVSYKEMNRIMSEIIEECVPFVNGEVECDARELSSVMWNFLIGV